MLLSTYTAMTRMFAGNLLCVVRLRRHEHSEHHGSTTGFYTNDEDQRVKQNNNIQFDFSLDYALSNLPNLKEDVHVSVPTWQHEAYVLWLIRNYPCENGWRE